MRGQPGFWDVDERYARLSEAGDPLEKLSAVVPWEVFRKPLAKALKRSDGSKGGRPPYDPVFMFKIMVLQALYTLSDDQAEFLLQDRLSFMRFLGVSLSDRVPDAKTIWLFREHLAQAGAVENLFAPIKAETGVKLLMSAPSQASWLCRAATLPSCFGRQKRPCRVANSSSMRGSAIRYQTVWLSRLKSTMPRSRSLARCCESADWERPTASASVVTLASPHSASLQTIINRRSLPSARRIAATSVATSSSS